MRLLIISHTPHYMRDGRLAGWGATVREIDELARLFDSIVHIAPIYDEEAPSSAMPYSSDKVRVRTVKPAGGESLADKLTIPFRFPDYAWAMLEERKSADFIHVRCPANISLLALIVLRMTRGSQPCWIKYAGDWNRGAGEPLSYRFQRWWLSGKLRNTVVTVNGSVPNQASHIHSFLNPCLLPSELEEGLEASRKKTLIQPARLVFVGRIESAKGVGICLEVVLSLEKCGIIAHLDLIGEGEETVRFERLAQELGIASRVKFHGGIARDELGKFYSTAHFIVLPSDSEGWPKVLSEAMAYGAVPIATAVGSIAEHLGRFATGQAITERDSEHFTRAIAAYFDSPAIWETHSRNAAAAASQFSYESYLRSVRAILQLPAGKDLLPV